MHSKGLKKLCRIQQQHFSRNRLLNFPTLVTFFINLAKRSLQIELRSFMRFAKLPDVSKQALSKARKKLSPKAFILLNNKLIDEFYTDNAIDLFNGYRVLAVDGTTACLPKADGLLKKFGTAEGAHKSNCPMARISVLFDVLNKLTLQAEIESYNTSEKVLAVRHLDCLKAADHQAKDLLLFDRNYPSTELIFLLQLQNKDFLMRCSRGFRSDVVTAAKTDNTDKVITFKALRKSGKPNKHMLKEKLPHLTEESSVQLRILSFRLKSGEKEILITNLLDKEKFPTQTLFNLYAKRWEIEENYKFYKSALLMENFSGKSELAVQQDFYATVLTSNMASLLIQEAQAELEEERKEQKHKYNYKINKNISIGLLKDELIDILLRNKDLDTYCENLKSRIKKNLVPIRPNRSFSRKRNREKSYHQNQKKAI